MATQRRVEVELKYEVTAHGDADRYLVAPELGPFKPAGGVRSVQIEDRYVDSTDWALARAGFAARLRRTSRGTLISLKAQSTSGNHLQRREEIEGPAGAEPEPADWPASEARTVILELCGDEPLVELLTIRQTRRVRRLEAGDTRAELSLDEVEVFGNDTLLDSFDELEVELRKGSEEPLAALAELLGRDESLRPVSRSKLDRAVLALRTALPAMPEAVQKHWQTAPPELFDRRQKRVGTERPAGVEPAADAGTATDPDSLAEGRTRSPRRSKVAARPAGPRSLGVGADDSMPEAAGKILRFHFTRLLDREVGTRSGSDVEDLHDMRVAARRMRAAWRIFDDAFRSSRTKKLRRRLETLSDGLGTVRDLDVLIGGLEAYREGLDIDQRPGLDPLLSVWSRQRDTAREELLRGLDSPGHEAFVKEMEAFLDGGSNAAATVATPTLPHRVRDRAPSQLWAAYETVRAYEMVLPWADVETLHQLRIAAKRLRYALEFFGETLGPDSTRLLERVVALQDHLGCLHDADVAAKLARDVLVARAGQLTKPETEAIGAFLHSREREVARRRRAVGPIWRAVAGAPFRRALGRATAAL
ncbi:MAG: CHAD domain-containing protein [Candidatus Limnocylindrales bacterium]